MSSDKRDGKANRRKPGRQPGAVSNPLEDEDINCLIAYHQYTEGKKGPNSAELKQNVLKLIRRWGPKPKSAATANSTAMDTSQEPNAADEPQRDGKDPADSADEDAPAELSATDLKAAWRALQRTLIVRSAYLLPVDRGLLERLRCGQGRCRRTAAVAQDADQNAPGASSKAAESFNPESAQRKRCM